VVQIVVGELGRAATARAETVIVKEQALVFTSVGSIVSVEFVRGVAVSTNVGRIVATGVILNPPSALRNKERKDIIRLL